MSKVTHTGGVLETLRLEDEAAGSLVSLAPMRGGMVTRFAVGAVPVLFLDEATLADPTRNVRGGIPILFPIAGKLPGTASRGRCRGPYSTNRRRTARA